MNSLFMGLGIGCIVRSVDSPRYVFTVSVPGRGIVLVHRKIDRFCDLELDEDFVFLTVGRSFFGIAKQIRLSPAHLLAIQPPKEKEAASAPESEAARVVLESPELDFQALPSENKGIKALEVALVTKKEMEKRETERKARFKASKLKMRREEGERKKRKENGSSDENWRRRRKEKERKKKKAVTLVFF